VLTRCQLQKFLETRQRGALITNADYRTKASAEAPTQPAFDWMTLPYFHQTCDRIFQESVVTYKPNLQVVVFIFLLSASGNSMAVWRRKITVPEGVRLANKDAITQVMEDLPQDKVVYVDEYVAVVLSSARLIFAPGFFRQNRHLQNHQRRKSVAFGNGYLDASEMCNFVPHPNCTTCSSCTFLSLSSDCCCVPLVDCI
jgi:hypothetical protein